MRVNESEKAKKCFILRALFESANAFISNVTLLLYKNETNYNNQSNVYNILVGIFPFISFHLDYADLIWG